MSNAAASQPQPSPVGGQATATRIPQDRSVRLPGEDLSLNEMLRVMDVAREMQRNRELAQEMFRRDEVRTELRSKLMRSAQLAGDRVTEAEIDAAIDQYFATLNVYKDPEPSFKRFLAHTWVWRKRIAAGVAAIAITLAEPTTCSSPATHRCHPRFARSGPWRLNKRRLRCCIRKSKR